MTGMLKRYFMDHYDGNNQYYISDQRGLFAADFRKRILNIKPKIRMHMYHLILNLIL